VQCSAERTPCRACVEGRKRPVVQVVVPHGALLDLVRHLARHEVLQDLFLQLDVVAQFSHSLQHVLACARTAQGSALR
jgi:hypothetical protein